MNNNRFSNNDSVVVGWDFSSKDNDIILVGHLEKGKMNVTNVYRDICCKLIHKLVTENYHDKDPLTQKTIEQKMSELLEVL